MSQISTVLSQVAALMPQMPIAMPQISIELLLIAGRAVFLVFSFVIAAVTFTRWRRGAQRSTEQLTVQNSLILERLAAIEERVASANFRVAELAKQLQGELRAASTTSDAQPRYQTAIALAREGASRDELIVSCGLTRQEADLVLRVHASKQGLDGAQVAA
jgi:membrane protein implicated in regulation of membrane protease activity